MPTDDSGSTLSSDSEQDSQSISETSAYDSVSETDSGSSEISITVPDDIEENEPHTITELTKESIKTLREQPYPAVDEDADDPNNYMPEPSFGADHLTESRSTGSGQTISVSSVTEAPSPSPDHSRGAHAFMANRSIPLLFMQFCVPAAFGLFVQMLYAIIDIAVVGRSSSGGDDAVAAISLFYPIESLAGGIGSGLGMGLNAGVSQALGERDYTKTSRTVCNTLLLGIIICIAYPAALFFLLPFFFDISGANDDIMAHALPYGRILLAGAFGQVLYICANNILRADGRPNWAMVSMTCSAAINVTLDLVLILALDMGTTGCAIATVTAQVVPAAVIFAFYTFFNESGVRIRLSGFIPEPRLMFHIVLVSVALFVQRIGGSLKMFVANLSFSYIIDEDQIGKYLAASQIVSRSVMFLFVPLMAIGQGQLPIIGYAYGAHLYRRLAGAVAFALAVGIAIGIVAWAILMAGPYVYLRLFTNDAETLRIGSLFARIQAAMFWVVGYQMLISMTFIAIKMPLLGMVSMFARQMVVAIPLIILFTFTIKTPESIMATNPIADTVATVLTVIMSGVAVWRLWRRAVLHRRHIIKTAPHSEVDMLEAMAEEVEAF
ncbi:Multi antimicrobial extrusion protein [Carpediemonas membranifera]|uniref:Multi antimicrobial extrusion protein n=1 Tax=Carpediemonas membranifera TaxID=201153 RepID=A0A8J6BVA5_9EUKA|nr:Multi antimicrobial extrusion protein [Carpediemonas membranifera]|eukprot:KAG9391221.1 Multi antimicrobial extrusion protein [Carpediemonas membranifera]